MLDPLVGRTLGEAAGDDSGTSETESSGPRIRTPPSPITGGLGKFSVLLLVLGVGGWPRLVAVQDPRPTDRSGQRPVPRDSAASGRPNRGRRCPRRPARCARGDSPRSQCHPAPGGDVRPRAVAATIAAVATVAPLPRLATEVAGAGDLLVPRTPIPTAPGSLSQLRELEFLEDETIVRTEPRVGAPIVCQLNHGEKIGSDAQVEGDPVGGLMRWYHVRAVVSLANHCTDGYIFSGLVRVLRGPP